MQVSEIMSSAVHTCRPQDSLESAARLLWEHDCGVLPVVAPDGRPGAAITDRDICMGAYTTGRRLADVRVAEAMSKALFSCRADDSVAAAARVMAEHRVRRLPVVDKDGVLRGMLSLNDVCIAAEQDPSLGRDVLKTLAAVCRHRAGAIASAPASAPAATAAAPRAAAVAPSDTAKARAARGAQSA